MTNHPHRCDCGAPAYVGFSSIECSSPMCRHFKSPPWSFTWEELGDPIVKPSGTALQAQQDSEPEWLLTPLERLDPRAQPHAEIEVAVVQNWDLVNQCGFASFFDAGHVFVCSENDFEPGDYIGIVRSRAGVSPPSWIVVARAALEAPGGP